MIIYNVLIMHIVFYCLLVNLHIPRPPPLLSRPLSPFFFNPSLSCIVHCYEYVTSINKHSLTSNSTPSSHAFYFYQYISHRLSDLKKSLQQVIMKVFTWIMSSVATFNTNIVRVFLDSLDCLFSLILTPVRTNTIMINFIKAVHFFDSYLPYWLYQ